MADIDYTLPLNELLSIAARQEQKQTRADRMRAISDESLAEKLWELWQRQTEHGDDIAIHWCRPDCCNSEECEPAAHKVCILRWLREPADRETGAEIDRPTSAQSAAPTALSGGEPLRTSDAHPYGVQHGHGNGASKAPPPTQAGHRRQKGMRRLAVALVGLLGLMLTVVVLAYRYPLQNGPLRLCAAVVFGVTNFVCGMIFERAK